MSVKNSFGLHVIVRTMHTCLELSGMHEALGIASILKYDACFTSIEEDNEAAVMTWKAYIHECQLPFLQWQCLSQLIATIQNPSHQHFNGYFKLL
jgi:hypothetical protein